jgi:hypothetical protein
VLGGVRLAELLATVSLATDLAHDVPAESALRDTLFSVRLARLAGWSRDDLSDTYYLALLYHVGCTGAVSIQSRMGAGDDVGVRDVEDRGVRGGDEGHAVQNKTTNIDRQQILTILRVYLSAGTQTSSRTPSGKAGDPGLGPVVGVPAQQ